MLTVIHLITTLINVYKLLFTLICAQGEVHLDPTIFKFFPVGISVQILLHLNIHQDNHKSAKRTLKNVPLQNGGPKTNFRFRENSQATKNVKKHISKGILQ